MDTTLLDSGQLSARLELEMPQPVTDGQGGIVAGYAIVASLWAMIEPVAMPDREQADRAVFSITHRITIRFRDDVTAGMRFRKGARLFIIRAHSDPDERRRYLVCRCEEDGR
ncbi:phage head closure protein [Pararhizobium antarcticum]|uniref:Head-tail adaptor protein n=1 Tax=Pararhizobium antarcticum TaxID=1798805 RepID=A0A657LRB7_9HYPH|nr:phage head closure protein [Pararhizobium antarcticum]OJF95896.1 head-tail adaptor protein [Pararhizobium antarcticum]OJF99338.1 head-tail adaptor protein [Rhizobium sp. 58]